LLERLRGSHPDLPIIVITAHSDLESAVSAYKGGAFEYLPKPFDIDEAVELVHKAARQNGSGEEPLPTSAMASMIGQAPAMQEVFRSIGRLAGSSMTVLITGESGTGKELVAQALHEHSPRANKPFVPLNTSAIASELLESELFGHEKGSFTGAHKQTIGKIELAANGTLFLDEIATTSPSAQEKILRITEYGTYQRLGSNKTLSADVRIIGATNIDLPAAADLGDFRHDLLDRLALDVITLPPLRARKEDIIILAIHFGQKIAQERGWESFPGFSGDMTEKLIGHSWPGNIRELKNVIERACYYAEDEFEAINHIVLDPFRSPYRPQSSPKREVFASQPHEPTAEHGPTDYHKTLNTFEKELLQSALKANKFNQRQAADYLNLSYHQLRHQLKKHALLG